MNNTFVLPPRVFGTRQCNKERLKEQWTGNDAYITIHTLLHENSTYMEATPTLR